VSFSKTVMSESEPKAGGYLHTGDTGSIDAEGYLQLIDRLKNVIKSGGDWISSLQIEDIISHHDAVS